MIDIGGHDLQPGLSESGGRWKPYAPEAHHPDSKISFDKKSFDLFGTKSEQVHSCRLASIGSLHESLS